MSAYQLAVLLSGGSAALGLLREVLIYRRLGLGAGNDALQFALSITYTIALLGEPLRMASLNLISRRLAASSATLLAGVIALAVVATTIAYTAGGPALPATWITIAALAGAANLMVAWTVPRRLRDGPFIPVHALTVLPNVVIVAGLLVPTASDHGFAGRVVWLFLLAPLVQLAGFHLLGRGRDHATRPVAGRGELPAAIGWHGVSAAGGMTTQFLLRSALAAAPTGTLSAFTLVLRVAETLRAVFVDSWVASRLKRWTTEGAAGAVSAVTRLLPAPAAAGLALAGLAVALVPSGPRASLLAPAAIVVLAGLYPLVVYRVGWQALNTSGRPTRALARVAGLEAVIAALLGAALMVPGVPVAVLSWLAYVARPAAGVRIVAAPTEGHR